MLNNKTILVTGGTGITGPRYATSSLPARKMSGGRGRQDGSYLAELFQTTRNNITLHIGNVFKEKELEEISVGKDHLLTANDGKKYW